MSLSLFLIATGFSQFSFLSQILPFVSLLIKISSVVQMPQFNFCCSSVIFVYINWISRRMRVCVREHEEKEKSGIYSIHFLGKRKWVDASVVSQRIISNSNFSYIPSFRCLWCLRLRECYAANGVCIGFGVNWL